MNANLAVVNVLLARAQGRLGAGAYAESAALYETAATFLREAAAGKGNIPLKTVTLKGPITLLPSKPRKRRPWTPAQKKAAAARMRAWHAAKKKGK